MESNLSVHRLNPLLPALEARDVLVLIYTATVTSSSAAPTRAQSFDVIISEGATAVYQDLAVLNRFLLFFWKGNEEAR